MPTQLRGDAPEFVPSSVYNPDKVQPKYEQWGQGVHLSPDNTKKGHVDPLVVIPNMILSKIEESTPCSMSPRRRQKRLNNVR